MINKIKFYFNKLGMDILFILVSAWLVYRGVCNVSVSSSPEVLGYPPEWLHTFGIVELVIYVPVTVYLLVMLVHNVIKYRSEYNEKV